MEETHSVDITVRRSLKGAIVRAPMDLLFLGVPGFCSNQSYPVSLIGGCRSQSTQSTLSTAVQITPAQPSAEMCVFVQDRVWNQVHAF